jgi:4'-phosphopantetheinyl transferase
MEPLNPGVWEPAPDELRLAPGEVHVWRAALPDFAAEERFGEMLSQDEWARARRFHFERDRLSFVTTRGVLRELLGRYLGVDPAGLSFRYGPYGKPHLTYADRDIRFNVAHSGEVALYAFALGAEVGVDVEQHREGVAAEGIAERFFSRREVEVLRALPDAQRQAAFFACWSRKEAYIKAQGTGLSLGLDTFDVTLAPGDPPALLATRPRAFEASRWTLLALDVEAVYSAALVTAGAPHRVVLLRFEME